MASGGEEEFIPPNERPRSLEKRRNLVLRLLCGLILLAIVLLFVGIICVLVLTSAQSTDEKDEATTLKWVDLQIPPELNSTFPFNQSRQLQIPPGYKIAAYAHVPSARFLLALPGGDVLVSQPEEGKISLLQKPQFLARAAERIDFATTLNLPNDMVLHTESDGNQYLYISEATRVSRYSYFKGDRRIRTPYEIIGNLPYSRLDLHPHKSIAIVNNTLYVAIGSTIDANPIDLQSDPKRGAIYAYRLTGGQPRLISAGLRHVGNLAVPPNTSDLWAVVSQRDNLTYPYKNKNYGKYVKEFTLENPVDEFVKIVENEDYGWPHCNPVFDNKKKGTVKYVPDYDFNRDGKAVSCSSKRNVDAGIRAHSKPLGLTFWNGKKVKKDFDSDVIAIVALNGNVFHGNKVIYFSFNQSKPSLFPSDLVAGWVKDKDENSKWGQPVDIAVLDDESILISDNYSGAIYKLYRKLDY